MCMYLDYRKTAILQGLMSGDNSTRTTDSPIDSERLNCLDWNVSKLMGIFHLKTLIFPLLTFVKQKIFLRSVWSFTSSRKCFLSNFQGEHCDFGAMPAKKLSKYKTCTDKAGDNCCPRHRITSPQHARSHLQSCEPYRSKGHTAIHLIVGFYLNCLQWLHSNY